MNVIARLEYELAYHYSAVHRFNHYTTRTPPPDVNPKTSRAIFSEEWVCSQGKWKIGEAMCWEGGTSMFEMRWQTRMVSYNKVDKGDKVVSEFYPKSDIKRTIHIVIMDTCIYPPTHQVILMVGMHRSKPMRGQTKKQKNKKTRSRRHFPKLPKYPYPRNKKQHRSTTDNSPYSLTSAYIAAVCQDPTQMQTDSPSRLLALSRTWSDLCRMRAILLRIRPYKKGEEG